MRIKSAIAVLGVLTSPLFAQTLPIPQFDVLNATSYQPSLSPGVVAVIFGEGLTPSSQVGCVFSDVFGWSQDLHGVQVLVNQQPAFIASHCRVPQPDGLVAETLTCQFPTELAPGEAEIVVRVNNVASAPLEVTLLSHAPALAEFTSQTRQKLGAFQRFPTPQLVSLEAPAIPGEVLSVPAGGLGPTDPAVSEGQITPPGAHTTVTTPVMSIDGAAVEVLSAMLKPGHVGVYEVTFRVPSALTTGEHRVRLSVAENASNEVVLLSVGRQGPSIHAIVNAGSFAPNAPAAPGSILSLFVGNLQGESNTGLFPATDFAGLSVAFNGIRAPLFAVVAEVGQINVLAPLELPETGAVDVEITTAGGASGVFSLPMTTANPGIFSINDPADPNRRFATAMLANTAWLAIPDSVAEAVGLPVGCQEQGISPAEYCGRPVRPGDPVQVFLTGLGRATPDGDSSAPALATGQVAPASGAPLYRTVTAPQVTIGDVPAEVAFSGVAPGFAGLYQINMTIPATVPYGDTVPLRISMPNGQSDTAVIAIREP